MSEKRRLRGGGAEVIYHDYDQWHVEVEAPPGETRHRISRVLFLALTEPIPEEPKVGDDWVDFQWLKAEARAGRFHVAEREDDPGVLRSAYAESTGTYYLTDPHRGRGGRYRIVERWEEPKPTPVPPVDRVEEAWDKVRALAPTLKAVAEVEAIRAAFDATLAPLREQIQANDDSTTEAIGEIREHLTRIDEAIIDLRNRGETRAVRTVRGASVMSTDFHGPTPEQLEAAIDRVKEHFATPNPKEVMPDLRGTDPHATPPPVAGKDAAGGEEGPSVEVVDVVAWLQGLTCELRLPDAKRARAAIRLIREGQQEDRDLREVCEFASSQMKRGPYHNPYATVRDLLDELTVLRKGQRDTRPVLTEEMEEDAVYRAQVLREADHGE